MGLGASEWGFGYVLEMLSPSLEAKIFWDNVQFLGSSLIAPALLVFALLYTRQTYWLKRPGRWLLLVEPVITLALAFTNPWHHLIRLDSRLDSVGPFVALTYHYGLWLWIAAAYYYVLGLWAVVLLINRLIRSSGLYRRQVGFVLVGAVIPYLGGLLTIFGLLPLPVPNLDISPLSFSLGFLVIAWGVYRYHLLNIVPVARETVIESMADGVVVLDAQERILDLNSAARRLTGRGLDQLAGQPVAPVLPAWRDAIALLLAGTRTEIEIGLLRDGAQRDYDLHCIALHNDQGETVGWLLVLHDITERKQAENQIRQLNEELEDRVLERTRQLHQANAQLQIAKEAAEAASRAKSQFLATASHELRTPLNAIIGYAEILGEQPDGSLTEAQLEYVAHIHTSGLHLLGLINNILDFSKLEENRLTLNKTPFEVRAVLARLSQSAAAAQAKRIEFQSSLAPDVPAILVGDPERLGPALIYLTDNAFKFTASGSVVVSVNLAAKHDQQVTLRFAVRDTGIGIAPEQMAELFDAFTQADGSYTRQYSGLGIGLALSRRIVHLMGGELDVVSEPGKGSTFSFTAVFDRHLDAGGGQQPGSVERLGGGW